MTDRAERAPHVASTVASTTKPTEGAGRDVVRALAPASRLSLRLRGWQVAGIVGILLIGLAGPSGAASATAPPPARNLISGWASTHRVTTYSETSSRLTYGGTWISARYSGYLGGSARASTRRNASATIRFTGTGVAWIGPLGPTRGSARVYLDGRLVRTVNTYSSRFSPARALFSMTFGSSATRTLKIVVAGTAGHPTVAVDAIVVRTGLVSVPTPGATPAPGTTPAPGASPAPGGTPATGIVPSPGASPSATPSATASARPSASASSSPTPTPTATPTATLDPSGYDAVFNGDATGSSDVTSALQSFLQANDGKRVALAPNGVYRVSQVSFNADGITVDFRGARLQGTQTGAHGILRIESSSNVTLNDPSVSGTGYVWGSGTQNEHGIQIIGGSNITLNHPVVRDTRGDGIYITYNSSNDLPSGILILNPDVARTARSGIAPVAGQVTIRGGRVSQSGLHGINFEVNDDTGARSIVGVVDGVDVRSHGDLPAVNLTSYAVAAGGASDATKPFMLVQNMTGDFLRMTIRDTATVTVTGNVSETSATANFPGSDTVTFSGNVNITRQ